MDLEEKDEVTTSSEPQGEFRSSLKRTNKQIKGDRADAIAEDAEMFYSRKLQDLRQEMRKLNRERENLLDMSPANTHSLMPASDFKAGEFANTDHDLGIRIRYKEIELEIAEKRYEFLFGKTLK